MILLAFLSCLLVFFFVKDQIRFSIKANHCVFELSVPCVSCVCLFHCVIATEFDYRISTSDSDFYCMQLIV